MPRFYLKAPAPTAEVLARTISRNTLPARCSGESVQSVRGSPTSRRARVGLRGTRGAVDPTGPQAQRTWLLATRVGSLEDR
jgi:hypothetical protein